MKKFSIALFTYLPLEHGGGLAVFYKSISESLSKQYPHLSFTIITLSPQFADKITRIYSIYYLRRERQPVSKLESGHSYNYVHAKSFSHLAKLLTSFDVVYSKNDAMDLLLLAAAGYSHIRRLIIGFHTPIKYHMTPTLQSKFHNVLYGSPFYKSLIKKADAIHVLNLFHFKTLKKTMNGTPVHHIYNSIQITKGVNPKELNNPIKGVIRILWIGRLTQDKGADDLIWIVKKLQNKYPGRFSWTIVGDGPMRNQLEKLGAEVKGVKYLRALPHAKILALYSLNDVFVSTSKWECLPYVVLEAQHAGLPVIAYNIPGCSDIVVPGHTGSMSNTRGELFDTLFKFKRYSRSKRNAIARKTVARFNLNTITKQLYNLVTFSA